MPESKLGRLCRAAIELYPYDFRATFAADMLVTLDESPPRFRDLISIISGAGREWFVKLATNRYVRAHCLPDVRMMRPAGISKEIWFGPSLEKPPCASDTSR
jgi:hypothetical protein